MNPNRSFLSPAGCLLVPALVMTIPAHAQISDIETIVNQGLAAMNESKWEEGLAIHTDLIERFGKNNPLMLHGAQFGVIYYRKGICELRLGKWAEAMASFEICYRDFPNGKPGVKGRNMFNKLALLEWGNAAKGAENWELALTQYKKFLAEREPRDRFSQGTFYVNVAVCEYNLGRIPEGNEQLEIAIRNKEAFRTPDAAIVSGFQALVSAVIEKRNEQALLDFIANNRGEIVIEPFEMHRYSNVFLKLAGDAIGVDMLRSAMALYQMVPSTEAAIDDVRARLKLISDARGVRDGGNNIAKDVLERNLKTLEEVRRSKSSPEMVKLAAIAFIHEKSGNIRGAYAAYDQLERLYQNSSKREDNLYNLVRTASLLGEDGAAQRHADRFLSTFPESAHAASVGRVQLSSLFFNGQYEKCIETATAMNEKVRENPEVEDMRIHVLGGSYFHTGEYEKAKPLLEQHVKEFPESLFAVASQYFRASNESRLGLWTSAAKLFDEFIEKHPDPQTNIYLPFALLDRATCHYMEDQNEGALEKLSRVITSFPQSRVVDQAHNLRGNILESQGDLDEAASSYTKAFETAEAAGHHGVAGEALYNLIRLHGEKSGAGASENPDAKAAADYADKFWKDYAQGSPYVVQVAVAQMNSLKAMGRDADALERLQKVISEMAKVPEATGLEGAINTYTEAYLEKYSPDQLKEHYYNFPDIRSTDRAARALLRIAIIGVFEDVAKKAETPAEKNSANVMIRVLFQELKNDFALKDLTNFILVKLGDYLRTTTSTPREALPYYDEILGRQDRSYRFESLLGRGDVYGRSKTPADLDKGIADFRTVYETSDSAAQRELGLYHIVQLLMAKGDYEEAAKQANVYLDREDEKGGFTKHSPEVGLLLADSFRERKLVNDAIAMYMKIWSAQMGYIKVSAPAMKHWMELSWSRNNPGDRQGAYNGGSRFLSLTERHKDKMTEEEIKFWDEVAALVKVYGADPNINAAGQQ